MVAGQLLRADAEKGAWNSLHKGSETMIRASANCRQNEMIPAGQGVPDRGLAGHQRISSASVFEEAFSQKKCFVGKFLVMWLRYGDDANLRLGVVASKKTFRRAVDRNRARRLMREAYRLNRYRLAGSNDVVFVGRRKILDASLSEVETEILNLATKAGILREKD